MIRIYCVRVNRSMEIVATDELAAQIKFLKYLNEVLFSEDVECELICEGEELEE